MSKRKTLIIRVREEQGDGRENKGRRGLKKRTVRRSEEDGEGDGFRYGEANRAKSIINHDKFVVINNERDIDTAGKHKHL